METCGAHTKRGGICGKAAGWGTPYSTGRCKLHGGSTPTHQKHAQHQLAEQAVVTYGLPREIDPHTALLEELCRTAGHVAWLAGKISKLEDQALHGPVGGDSETAHPRHEPHIWVRLYQDERKHLAAVAAVCIRAGIEERRVTLAEQQGALLASVIKGILTDLGVADDPATGKVVRKHLTVLTGGRAA